MFHPITYSYSRKKNHQNLDFSFFELVIYNEHKILNQKHCDKEYLNMGPLVLLLQQGILQTPKCVTFPRGILEFALSTRIELDLNLNSEFLELRTFLWDTSVLLWQQGILQTPKCVTFPRGILEFALSTRIELDLSASCTAEDSHSEVLLLRSLYKIYTKERK